MRQPHPLKFCVAPMMDWTDRHCRVLHRLLSARARLYTEMVTALAVIHGNRARLLGFEARERPVALQLGGADPRQLAEAAAIGADFGYDEINLNVGCPSDRVQAGRFGACLMAEPELVGECVAAMRGRVGVPVTVKCRIGVDDQDPEAVLPGFARAMQAAGTGALIVHARKAWLKGLSPKENRDVPPLDYGLVYRLKAAMPDFPIILNGGIDTLEAAVSHLAHVDGVMMGRAAYQSPGILAEVDARLFDAASPPPDLHGVIEAYADYAGGQHRRGVPIATMMGPLLGLFHGAPGARGFRRHLTLESRRPGADARVIGEALALIGHPARMREAVPA
jgi:tRNA-dihydrouridine synthase A